VSINSFNQASILSFSAAVSSFTNYYEGYFEKVHPKKKGAGGGLLPRRNQPLGEVPGKLG
jgi:hypothetical protein